MRIKFWTAEEGRENREKKIGKGGEEGSKLRTPWWTMNYTICHVFQDIRLAQDPFPLYPGEVLKQGVTGLRVVMANSAIRLRAMLDYESESGEKRVAGDEWLFEGPGNTHADS